MPLYPQSPKSPPWNKTFTMITPGATSSTMTVVGGPATNTGTISVITATEAIGIMSQNTSSAGANALVGTAGTNLDWCRGSVAGFNGFNYFSRLYLPDASYNEAGASTGSRLFFGFSDQTTTTQLGSDDPAGNRCGFSRISVNGGLTDTNWFFSTKDSSTENRVDTGMSFAVQKVYDFQMFCDPLGTQIAFAIHNITDDLFATGVSSSNLPTSTVFMRWMNYGTTINATARKVGWARVYIEGGK